MPKSKSAPEKNPHSSVDTAKDIGKNAFTILEKEAKEIEKKFMDLPIDRRMIVFVGGVILIAAFLGNFGDVILALIALGMIYVGFSGNNFLTRFLSNKPQEKKK
jgi:hypothetical protein